MAKQPSFMLSVLIKTLIGLVLGAGLFVFAWWQEFPLIFRVMFVFYALLGSAVFILLDAPPMTPLSGVKAAIALLAFYLVLSGIYIGGASLWPQYDPRVEKAKIEKLLERRKEQAEQARTQVDALLKVTESLEAKARTLTVRLNKVAPADVQVDGDGIPELGPKSLVDQGQEVYDIYECYNCHKIGGKGSVKKRGPVLDNIGSLLTVGDIKKKIFDPGYLYAEGFEKEHKKGKMPDKYKDIMFEEELHALAVYLSTLKDPDGKTPRPVFVKTTVEHGFTVYGFVRDKSGKPVAGIEVQAKPLKKHGHPGSGATNEQGYYEIFLHLHNEDTGTKIVVSGKGAQAEIVADYDPTDHVTKRQASVDLVVGS